MPDDSHRSWRRKKPPEGVKKLGLGLPVSEGDVKQAYFEKARAAHPDHGGNVAEFLELQQAFEEAIEFAKRSGKRMPWIGAQLPVYLSQQAAIDLIEGWGGKAVVETLDWLENTVGEDFAVLGDRLTEIDLSGEAIGDDQLRRLASDAPRLLYVETLRLADTRVTDAGLEALPWLPSVHRFDLRGSGVSQRMRRSLAKLPGVRSVEGISRFGWLFGER